jgi:G:T-mismatch repair DNA endonuclease (very short patch repair protein)
MPSHTCLQCGKEFVPHRRQQITCSPRCHRKRLSSLKPTSIERAMYDALAELGVTFERQHAIGRWLVDAYLPATRTIVEAQGDFYHCNPAKYPDGPRSPIQIANVRRDAARLADLTADGYRVLNLWEADIRAKGAHALLSELLTGRQSQP